MTQLAVVYDMNNYTHMDNWQIQELTHERELPCHRLFVYLIPMLLLLRCAGGVRRWGKGLWGTGASIGHDRQPTSGEKNVERDEAEVLGDGGLVGGPSDTVVAGPTLLLYLDNANASAVTAEAAVLPSPAVTWWAVNTCRMVSTATLLLVATHLNTETVKGKAVFTLMVTFWALKSTGDGCKGWEKVALLQKSPLICITLQAKMSFHAIWENGRTIMKLKRKTEWQQHLAAGDNLTEQNVSVSGKNMWLLPNVCTVQDSTWWLTQFAHICSVLISVFFFHKQIGDG